MLDDAGSESARTATDIDSMPGSVASWRRRSSGYAPQSWGGPP